MDCRTARLLLEFDRPLASDLAPPDAEALRTHLADCNDCGRLAEAERTFDEQLGQAIRDVPVPEGLRERLLKRLANEREDWYRRWLLRGAGIAAAVALVSWGLWSWIGQRPELVSPEEMRRIAAGQLAQSPEEIEKWYRDRGVAMVAPRQVNYYFLTWRNFARIEGKEVPFLEFHRENAWARVFVVSDRQFNLANAANLAPADSGGLKVEVQTYPAGGPARYAFIIVYTGDSLDAFRLEESRPGT
jgi:hypothetical protein